MNKEFKNIYYKPEWKQGEGYELGTVHPAGNGFAVYDGKQNYMGRIEADGSITYNGEASEYKRSFLLSAKVILDK